MSSFASSSFPNSITPRHQFHWNNIASLKHSHLLRPRKFQFFKDADRCIINGTEIKRFSMYLPFTVSLWGSLSCVRLNVSQCYQNNDAIFFSNYILIALDSGNFDSKHWLMSPSAKNWNLIDVQKKIDWHRVGRKPHWC